MKTNTDKLYEFRKAVQELLEPHLQEGKNPFILSTAITGQAMKIFNISDESVDGIGKELPSLQQLKVNFPGQNWTFWAYNILSVKKHCLDKQRVREAIERVQTNVKVYVGETWDFTILNELKKELKL